MSTPALPLYLLQLVMLPEDTTLQKTQHYGTLLRRRLNATVYSKHLVWQYVHLKRIGHEYKKDRSVKKTKGDEY